MKYVHFAAPSVARLRDAFGVTPRDAQRMREIIHRSRTPYGALNLIDNEGLIANTFGVEEIEARRVTRNGDDTRILLYLNTGDTYSTTLCFDCESGRFFIGCWGDWFERHDNTGDEES